jgi:hypothetical protein
MTGTCLSIISLSIYTYLVLPRGTTSFDVHSTTHSPDNYLGYVPLTFIYLIAFFTSFGLLPVPWMLLSEVFPFKSRGLATGITGLTVNFNFF